MFMRHASGFLPIETARTELVLRLPDGAPWVLTMSAGIERFLGWYPRLDGIDPDGPLLSYRTVLAEPL